MVFNHIWHGLSPHLGSDSNLYFAFSILHFLFHTFNSSLHNPACFLLGSVKVKVGQTCPIPCDPMGYTVHGILQVRILYWVNFLQGIFPTQGSNPGLRHCRQILYQLNHKESPRILEWVAFPFSRGSSQPRDRTQVSDIAGRFFTSCTTREILRTKPGIVCVYRSPHR